MISQKHTSFQEATLIIMDAPTLSYCTQIQSSCFIHMKVTVCLQACLFLKQFFYWCYIYLGHCSSWCPHPRDMLTSGFEQKTNVDSSSAARWPPAGDVMHCAFYDSCEKCICYLHWTHQLLPFYLPCVICPIEIFIIEPLTDLALFMNMSNLWPCQTSF